MKLYINGYEIEEYQEYWGKKYIFFDNDNRFILNIVEMTIEEFEELSKQENDFEEYNLIKDYNVKTIAGYDWEIDYGKDQPCLWKAFKLFEKIGQRYAKINNPNIIYYRFDDERAHEAYKRWIEIKNYNLVYHENDIAVYYKESER